MSPTWINWKFCCKVFTSVFLPLPYSFGMSSQSVRAWVACYQGGRNRCMLAISIKEFYQAVNRSLSLFACKNSNTNRSVSRQITLHILRHLLCILYTVWLYSYQSVRMYKTSLVFCVMSILNPELGYTNALNIFIIYLKLYQYSMFLLLVDSMKSFLSSIVVSSVRPCLLVRLPVRVRPFIDYL